MKTGWEVKPLGVIGDVRNGGTPSKAKKEYWGGSIPWYPTRESNNKLTSNPKQMITFLGLDNSYAKIPMPYQRVPNNQPKIMAHLRNNSQ